MGSCFIQDKLHIPVNPGTKFIPVKNDACPWIV